MVIIYIFIGFCLWFVLYGVVLKTGLYIQDKMHKGAIKKWGTDIEDYEYNRFKFKLYVTLFFIGIPVLYFIGFVIYYIKGY